MKSVEQAALVAQIVGGVAVVVSLVFVGMQLKENAAVLEARAVFDLREANGLLVRDLVSNAELSDLLHRGYSDYASLSDLERWRFGLWVVEVLRTRLMAWKYGEQGLLDAEESESWRTATCDYLRYPGARKVWDQGGAYLRRDFREDVDRWCSGPDRPQ